MLHEMSQSSQIKTNTHDSTDTGIQNSQALRRKVQVPRPGEESWGRGVMDYR